MAALLYLHPSKTGARNPTSGIVGLWTDSRSRALGAFHDNYFADDRFRLRLFGGHTNLNLDFFGIGENPENISTQYNINADIMAVEFLARIPKTESWFFGFRHRWIKATVDFSRDWPFPGLPPLKQTRRNSGLGMNLSFDSRDDNYYPESGQQFSLVWIDDNERWGSDFDFDKTTANYKYFLPVNERSTLALRASLRHVAGDAPFYLLSQLDLRGFPAGRYLDNSSVSAHAEWRYKFFSRWGMVAFVESGRVAASLSRLERARAVTSYGLGLRWQAIASKSLHLGIDIAYSDDDNAIHLRVGESF